MESRSRLDKYQSLRSNLNNENNTSANDINSNMQRGRVNYPTFGARNNTTSYSANYETSDYGMLLKEHEDFLKELDENFGKIDGDFNNEQTSGQNSEVHSFTNEQFANQQPVYVQPVNVQYPNQQYQAPNQPYANPYQNPYPNQFGTPTYPYNNPYQNPAYVNQQQPVDYYQNPGYYPQQPQFTQPYQQPIVETVAVQPVVETVEQPHLDEQVKQTVETEKSPMEKLAELASSLGINLNQLIKPVTTEPVEEVAASEEVKEQPQEKPVEMETTFEVDGQQEEFAVEEEISQTVEEPTQQYFNNLIMSMPTIDKIVEATPKFEEIEEVVDTTVWVKAHEFYDESLDTTIWVDALDYYDESEDEETAQHSVDSASLFDKAVESATQKNEAEEEIADTTVWVKAHEFYDESLDTTIWVDALDYYDESEDEETAQHSVDSASLFDKAVESAAQKNKVEEEPVNENTINIPRTSLVYGPDYATSNETLANLVNEEDIDLPTDDDLDIDLDNELALSGLDNILVVDDIDPELNPYDAELSEKLVEDKEDDLLALTTEMQQYAGEEVEQQTFKLEVEEQQEPQVEQLEQVEEPVNLEDTQEMFNSLFGDYQSFDNYVEDTLPLNEVEDLSNEGPVEVDVNLLAQQFEETIDDSILDTPTENDVQDFVLDDLNEDEILDDLNDEPEKVKETNQYVAEPVEMQDEQEDVVDFEDFDAEPFSLKKEVIEEEIPFTTASKQKNESQYDELLDDTDFDDNGVFDYINNIISNEKSISTPVDEMDFDYEDSDLSFNLDDDSLDDITRAISAMDLDKYNFTSDVDDLEPYYEPVANATDYEPQNNYTHPIYRDDPEAVNELNSKFEKEKALREEMLEQTKQLQFQMSEYENELDDANDKVAKTNKILNLILTILIMALFIIIFIIGFWFFKERGLL